LNVLWKVNKKLFKKDSKYFTSFDDYIHDKMIPISELKISKTDIPDDIIVNDHISYKKLIIKAYDVAKVMHNPFKVIDNVKHYKGYLEGMYSTCKGGAVASNIYETVINNASDLFKSLNIYKKA